VTAGVSIFIIALTAANIAGALWLLWWTRRSPNEPAATAQTTGHVWDEDLTELNTPLPRWWLWLFLITVVFGLGYLLLYPGLGEYRGTLGWSARAEHDAQANANRLRIEKSLAPFAGRTVSELTTNAAALNTGRNLFLNNCAACHGSDGGGAPGFPNLTDADWLWGGEPDTVAATIADGRTGMMPPWGEALGEQGVADVVAHVLSLSGRKADKGDATAGAARFTEMCSACHGAEGRGNPLLGAPNLTDGVWLHGGAPATLRTTVANGRMGAMPAHAARLGDTRVKLLAAYVLTLDESKPAK
jgi:cytochrome c oxidase cbb3-type subunit 3